MRLRFSAIPALLLVVAAVCAQPLPAQKRMQLRAATAPIVIDGRIDAAWAAADSAADFVQYQPLHHSAPTRETVAKVLTTPDALYCLIVCRDDPRRIRTNTGVLDDYGGDIVSIMLDTFGDKRTAYKFAVSAGGVRADCRLLDDARNRDYNWDGVWFSDARVEDWGYVVEMEIPYRTIQYDRQLTEWGLDFDRWIPDAAEDIYWCAYEENEGQRISKFGTLVLNGLRPSVRGLNLEIYPVGLVKTTYLRESVYRLEPDAGIDIFYNPSQALTFQLTGNPDFAQIEADPFAFNISRYETYFSERRPFFTQGNEVFAASGKQRNSGFYSPMELFYSRRIGRKLPDGSETPLLLGAKGFGRPEDWEYGGFVAATGETEYTLGGTKRIEERATFASGRVKTQILDNSSIGVLFVGKSARSGDNGVLDLDGALRGADWQLAWQLARSMNPGGGGDFAGSAGFMMFTNTWGYAFRARAVGNRFDVDQVGFVPWRGQTEIVALSGPRWYFEGGSLRELSTYAGGALQYEHADLYTDRSFIIGGNLNFRSNWGFEINLDVGRARDNGVEYPSFEINGSTWINTSTSWNVSAWGGYDRTYNFARNWQAFYSWFGAEGSWLAFDQLAVGSSLNAFIEGNPSGSIEEVTWNARPFVNLTPVNDLSIRVYVDNVLFRSTGRVERLIGGLLFSWQFLPKSWLYFAINEVQARGVTQNDPLSRMMVQDRAAVLKLKYLYYL